MARLYSLGFELGSNATSMEFGAAFGTIAVNSTAARSGDYGLHIASLASGTAEGFRHQFKAAGDNGPFWVRYYFKFVTFPGAENRIILLNDTDNQTTPMVYLTIDSSGVLKLYDEDGQITGTTTLSTGNWYNIEVKYDRTAAAGSHVVEARVDGAAAFASASNRDLSAAVWVMHAGGNLNSEANTTGEWYVDDVAVNDGAGSFQNGYPGNGSLVVTRPDAAGDNSDWTNDYTTIDEVTPNDATDFISSGTLDQIEDVNLAATPSAIGSGDTINVVHVGTRFTLSSAAGTDPRFNLRVKASSGGTVEESASQNYNATTWVTYSAALPRNPVLTLYDLPGGSTTAWTKADLDAAQIGVRINTGDTDVVQVTALWLYIDYTPAGGPATLTVNVSDGLTVGETVSVNLTREVNVTDGLAVGESHSVEIQGVIADRTINVSDGLTVGEILTVALLSINTSDSIALGEQVTVSLGIEISRTEGVTVGEDRHQFIFIPTGTDWSGSTVVIEPNPTYGTWDYVLYGASSPGAVIKFNGLYYFYYCGGEHEDNPPTNDPAHRALGVATSTDLFHWTKYSGNPIVTYTTTGGAVLNEGVASPTVFVDGGTIRMYYGAIRDIGSDMVDIDLRYRESTDGLTFTNDTLILSGAGSEYVPIAATKVGSTYSLYFLGPLSAGKGALRRLSGSSPTSLSNNEVVTSDTFVRGSIFAIDSDVIAWHLDRRNISFPQIQVRTTNINLLPAQISGILYEYNLNLFGEWLNPTLWRDDNNILYMYGITPDANISVRTFALSPALVIAALDDIAVGESHSVNAGAVWQVNVTDGVVITDTPHYYSDSVTLGESVSLQVQGAGLAISVSDGVTVGDTASVTLPDALAVSRSDGVVVGEAVAASIGLEVNKSDGVAVGESVNMLLTSFINVSDGAAVGESANVSITVAGVPSISVSDAVTVGESVSVSLPDALVVSRSDGVALGESVSALLGSFISVTDGAAVAESISVSLLMAGITVSDSIAVGESVIVSPPDILFVSAEGDDIVSVYWRDKRAPVAWRDKSVEVNWREKRAEL